MIMPTRRLRAMSTMVIALVVVLSMMCWGPARPAGALTPRILAQAPVSRSYEGPMVNPTTGFLYGVDFFSGVVDIRDGDSLATVGTIELGPQTRALAVDPVRNLVYMGTYTGSRPVITVIDGVTNTLVTSFTVPGSFLGQAAINTSTGAMYVIVNTNTEVPNVNDTSLVVIDATTHQITSSIPLPEQFATIAVNSTTGKVYVAEENAHTVLVIDGSSLATLASVVVGRSPNSLCVNETTNTLYVATTYVYNGPGPIESEQEDLPGGIWVIDGATDRANTPIVVGLSPKAIVCNSTTNQVFFSNHYSRDVAIVDGVSRTIVGSIGYDDTRDFFTGSALNPTTGHAYFRNFSPNSLVMIDASFVRPVLIPSAPTIDSVTREDSGLTIAWTDGGEELTARTVRVYDGAELVATDTSCSTSPCMIQGRHNGTAYTVTMTETNAKGTGPASAPSSPVTPAATPVAPLVSSTPGPGSAAISWSPADDRGSPITDYLLSTSIDGTSWTTTDLHSTATATELSLPVASARWVRVAGVNDVGIGSFSDPVVATSAGTAPQDVQVLTASGPVTGGSVSWEMEPRTAWSSKSYGLLSDGSIHFPAAPAGHVVVTISDGVLPDGTLLSGKLRGVLGLGTLVLTPPDEPAVSASTIHVETPSRSPLSGATVTLSGVSASKVSEGVTFTVPAGSQAGVTDLNGDFHAYGFASPGATATASFDDGVITQQKAAPLTLPTTTITMPYNPEVQPTVTSAEVKAGEVVVETLRVSGPSNQRPALRGASSPPRAGIVVTANLPKGTPVGSCGAVLSAVTNAKGKAKLRICATATGTIRFSATGAYVVGALRLLVKGAAPTAVQGLHASTPSTGCLKIGWSAPEYTGGRPVTSYSLYLTAPGQPTVSLTTTKTSAKVKGLANATRYRVWVAARTSKGAGPGTSITAPVA